MQKDLMYLFQKEEEYSIKELKIVCMKEIPEDTIVCNEQTITILKEFIEFLNEKHINYIEVKE